MADHSAIEWTEATWNPIAGCSIVSPGCTNCYAMRRVAPRLAANPATPHYAGTVMPSKAGPVWTGKIGIATDRILTAPLRWRAPRRIFVNSTSDLFHEDVPDEAIDRIFAVMALSPQHTFQVLTKRSARMREWFADPDRADNVGLAALAIAGSLPRGHRCLPWPLPNVWLGVSAEDQMRADERIPDLLATPAAIRFVSAEPLLGPIDLAEISFWSECCIPEYGGDGHELLPALRPEYRRGRGPGLDWIITGGESGPGARPMHPAWARSIRDQCAAAGVPFFFKQWGEWLPINHVAESFDLYHPAPIHDPERSRRCRHANLVLHADGMTFDRGEANDYHRSVTAGAHAAGSGSMMMFAVGKHRAGRLLDGVEHNGFPPSHP